MDATIRAMSAHAGDAAVVEIVENWCWRSIF
jgi:hypothetical protein